MATYAKTAWRFVRSVLMNNDPVFMALLGALAVASIMGPHLVAH